jgi:hypothetical protein
MRIKTSWNEGLGFGQPRDRVPRLAQRLLDSDALVSVPSEELWLVE